MTSFTLLRHGETDWNVQKRLQGRTKHVPLNANGVYQAQKAASILKGCNVDLIISSSLERAASTAKMIADELSLPILYDERLIERDFGIAEGVLKSQFHLKTEDEFYTEDGAQDWILDTRQPKGSETKEEVIDRAYAAVSELVKKYDGKHILFVTHAAWIRALLFHLCGFDEIVPNATPCKVIQNDGMWNIEFYKEEIDGSF